MLKAGEPIADAEQTRRDLVDGIVARCPHARACVPPDVDVVDRAAGFIRCLLYLVERVHNDFGQEARFQKHPVGDPASEPQPLRPAGRHVVRHLAMIPVHPERGAPVRRLTLLQQPADGENIFLQIRLLAGFRPRL